MFLGSHHLPLSEVCVSHFNLPYYGVASGLLLIRVLPAVARRCLGIACARHGARRRQKTYHGAGQSAQRGWAPTVGRRGWAGAAAGDDGSREPRGGGARG